MASMWDWFDSLRDAVAFQRSDYDRIPSAWNGVYSDSQQQPSSIGGSTMWNTPKGNQMLPNWRDNPHFPNYQDTMKQINSIPSKSNLQTDTPPEKGQEWEMQ